MSNTKKCLILNAIILTLLSITFFMSGCSTNYSNVNNSKKVICTPHSKGVENGSCDIMIVDGVEFTAKPTTTITPKTDIKAALSGLDKDRVL